MSSQICKCGCMRVGHIDFFGECLICGCEVFTESDKE